VRQASAVGHATIGVSELVRRARCGLDWCARSPLPLATVFQLLFTASIDL
jgi:hypothetical protein